MPETLDKKDPAVDLQRRAAVAHGLRSIPLDQSQIQRGLELWDHLFAVQQPHALAHYVDTLAALLKLSERERTAARLSILREMISTSLDLRPPRPSASEAAGASPA